MDIKEALINVQNFLNQNPAIEGAQSILLEKNCGLTFNTVDGIMTFTKTRETDVANALNGRRFVNWEEVIPKRKSKVVEDIEPEVKGEE